VGVRRYIEGARNGVTAESNVLLFLLFLAQAMMFSILSLTKTSPGQVKTENQFALKPLNQVRIISLLIFE
jgi:hypothetical protein